MQQDIRFATFNVCNLALPGTLFYDNLPAYTPAEYDTKVNWLARQLDMLDADVIGFQEIFSQQALRDVLARTEKYRDAHHAGFDPDPSISPLTPSVALVSRLPFASAPVVHADLPGKLVQEVPAFDKPMTRFMRPVLHAHVLAPNGKMIQVLVLHLKSKRPDYLDGEDKTDPFHYDLASLRSLYRRGVEAAGLRQLLDTLLHAGPTPMVVLGDFNDTAESVTTELVLGAQRDASGDVDCRLFDAARIQARGDFSRRAGYTHAHGEGFNTLDHILVSREFHPAYDQAIGMVMEVAYFNDHIAMPRPEASDHGQVLARIALL